LPSESAVWITTTTTRRAIPSERHFRSRSWQPRSQAVGRPPRDAEDDTRHDSDARTAGVTGSPLLHQLARAAQFAIDAGWFISFSGIVTFRKWTDDDLLRAVPLDRLLVESDSPYLAPVPFRGKRNEPAWVPRTIGKLAAARNDAVEEVARNTARNAQRLFGLALEAA
jgi:TatD DNase family protein